MTILTAICLVYMLAVATSVLMQFARADSKVKFVKSFKKGQFVLIYVAGLPLFAMAHYYNGLTIDGAVVSAIKSTVEMVTLQFDYEAIALLAQNNLFYMVTAYLCFVLVAINAGLFVFSFAVQMLKNWRGIKKAGKKGVKVFVFVGESEQNFDFAKSVIKNGDKAMVFANLSNCDKESLCEQNVPYVIFNEGDDLAEKLKGIFRSFEDKKVNLVINTGDDKQNVLFAGQVAKLCSACNREFLGEEKTGFDVYVYGETENLSAYDHLVSDTCGCIRFINRNNIIAMDFLDSYPITKFFNENHADYSTSLVKEGVDINVAFVGFGKTNQALFNLFATASQLMTKQNGKITAKKINYLVFDKENPENKADLAHNYFRFTRQNDWKTGGEYLPMPEVSVNDRFFECNVNDQKFYDILAQNVVSQNPYNYVIVACGDDLTNLNLCYRLVQKFKEWGIYNNTKLFVHIKDCRVTSHLQQECGENMFTFGCDKTLDINNIVNERSEKMAKLNHLTYSAEFAGALDQTVKAKAKSEWYGMTQTQRDSNVWSCLGIRTKLQLLGFDYIPVEEKGEDATQDFLSVYTQGDPILYKDESLDGRQLIKYANANFKPDTVRGIFAQHEHQRWNMSMLFAGVVPSDIEQIKTDKKGKRMDLRRHGNLTTFDGLVDFAKIVADQPQYNVDEEGADVIRYDYRVMDNVVWLLEKTGYKIVKK